MKVNYKELIEEISDEVKEGILTPEDTIQILRDTTPVFENYCPVIDWYYDDYTMNEELNTPLEDMYLPEEFSTEEWEQMKSDNEELKKQYAADKESLVSMKVKDILTEMKQIQKLLG